MSKTTTSYYLRYQKPDVFGFCFVDVNNLTSLEKEIKKHIDVGISFEVLVRFNFEQPNKASYGFSDYTSFEVWCYEAETDEVFNFNLRKNIYYKRLRRYERRLRKVMKTYNFKRK